MVAVCGYCWAALSAADEAELQLLQESHRNICHRLADRNVTQTFGFAKEPIGWRDRLTVEDARFLAALRIDPL